MRGTGYDHLKRMNYLQVCNKLAFLLRTRGIEDRWRWLLTCCFVDWKLVSMVYCGKGLQGNLPSVLFSFPFFPEIGESKYKSSIVQVIINFRCCGDGIEKRQKRVKRK
jgi:hypothetical protein